MAIRSSSLAFACLALCSFLVLSDAQLSASFYDKSCPSLTSVVRSSVKQAVQKENRMAASLLRLHFHDCFVNGCDGSILLDGSSSEKTAGANANSARGFDVVDNVKSAVEKACPGVVSCADILTLIAREAVLAVGGPSWTVAFGRRDSRTSSASDANSNIPAPTMSASALVSSFSGKGLSAQDLVALSGGHTIGQAQCRTFRARLYNTSSGSADPNMDESFRTSLKQNCPQSGGDSNLSPLDLQTPGSFDNFYFKDLQAKKGLLNSDQQLVSGGQSNLATFVTTFANNQQSYFNAFASAMVKMGNISPLTGTQGEIRKSCRNTN